MIAPALEARLHPGIPCPRRLADGARADGQHQAYAAYYEASLWGRLICPLRYEPRNPDQRCLHCGALNRYERIVPAWVTLRAEGDPDDEYEVNTDLVEDTATIRCTECGVDDQFDKISRPPIVLPDWAPEPLE